MKRMKKKKARILNIYLKIKKRKKKQLKEITVLIIQGKIIVKLNMKIRVQVVKLNLFYLLKKIQLKSSSQ